MDSQSEERFIRRVEGLIDPAEVCDLSFFQRFRKLMPASLFKRMLIRTSARTPYMGFVIEPYCLFLFFRIRDVERARRLLPDRYELVKTSIFADGEPDYYQGMGIFNTKASTFWGTRLESYLIARDRETGLMSWIFIDIISNTLIALPRPGVRDRNCAKALYTTNSRGDLFLDMEEERTGRRLSFKGNITRGVGRALDQPLWLSGNTSIAHSRELSAGRDDPFAVIFDPAEVETALEIPPEDITIRENSLFPGLAEKEISRALCFPFAQHYIADSPGCRTYIRYEEDMAGQYRRIGGMENLKTFSTGGIRKLFFGGILLSWLLSGILLLLFLM